MHFSNTLLSSNSITTSFLQLQTPSSFFYRLFRAVLQNNFNAFQSHLKRYPHHANLVHPQTHQPLIYCIMNLLPYPSTISSPLSSTFPTPAMTGVSNTMATDFSFSSSSSSSLLSPQLPTFSLHTSDTTPSMAIAPMTSTTFNGLDVSKFVLYLLSDFMKEIYTARELQTNNTILMTAIQLNHLEIIECILTHATEEMKQFFLECKNELGQCPLMLACKVGDVEVVKKLMNSGSNLHSIDELGNTPLHYAKAFNHYNLVTYLLARGSNFMARNQQQWSVMDYAYSYEMQYFFEEAMKTWMSGVTEFEQVTHKSA